MIYKYKYTILFTICATVYVASTFPYLVLPITSTKAIVTQYAAGYIGYNSLSGYIMDISL